MKRILVSLVALLLIITSVPFSSAKASVNNLIFVVVNDEMVQFPDTKPFVSKGTTYVPMRFFANSLGNKVRWDAKNKAAYIGNGEKQVILYPDKNIVRTDAGNQFTYPLKMVDGRVTAPYRFVGEYFGFYVTYIKEGPIARIYDNSKKLTNVEVVAKYKEEIEQIKESLKPKKTAYVTFDDGPNIHTNRILTILDRYDAKATFFMIDWRMKNNKNLVTKMKNRGHGLACHGVTHEKSKFYASPSSAYKEMNQCLNTVKSITGVKSNIIRVPYGSKPYMTYSYQAKMNQAGYHMWDWTVDSLDWKFLNGPKTASYTINQVKSLEKKGIAPIILFHDKSTTADGLATVLSYLKNNGYELAPLTNDMKPYNFWNKKYIYLP
jgi:peptidoglycan-N-acetylglucosamine deacetylase